MLRNSCCFIGAHIRIHLLLLLLLLLLMLQQQTGHKLRVQIADTAIISAGGVLQAWLHTNTKAGVVLSVPRCQLSTAALLQKLKGQHAPYEAANPDGWVAVAHFSNGLSWLVDAAGLEQLVGSPRSTAVAGPSWIM